MLDAHRPELVHLVVAQLRARRRRLGRAGGAREHHDRPALLLLLLRRRRAARRGVPAAEAVAVGDDDVVVLPDHAADVEAQAVPDHARHAHGVVDRGLDVDRLRARSARGAARGGRTHVAADEDDRVREVHGEEPVRAVSAGAGGAAGDAHEEVEDGVADEDRDEGLARVEQVLAPPPPAHGAQDDERAEQRLARDDGDPERVEERDAAQVQRHAYRRAE